MTLRQTRLMYRGFRRSHGTKRRWDACDLHWTGAIALAVTASCFYQGGARAMREFYCGLSVTASDAITLQSLRKSATDWRLQDGAQELIWLLDGAAQPPASIFNPAHSQYLLKHGCV